MKRFLALLLSALMVLSLLTACGSKSDETTPDDPNTDTEAPADGGDTSDPPSPCRIRTVRKHSGKPG